MEIKSYKVSAVIPTGQYANIQPCIELEGGSLEDMHFEAMYHIKDMFGKYSEQPLKESDVAAQVKMMSFNEKGVEVDFDPVLHKYFHDGKQLESASVFTERYTKPFDAKAISKACSKSWGVPAATIESMWSDGGTLASDFGTMAHKALENWVKYREIGEKIMESADKDINPALPKHPFLKHLIESFDEICGVGDYLGEVFVTDIKSGTCGQIDRLKIVDHKKKICRIQDYKFNVGAEEVSSTNKLTAPFHELPANKLSKYQVQMSYYGKVLEPSGWTIEGTDAFVYEDEWKHFELDYLKI